MTQMGSRTTVASKMDLFMTAFDSFHSLIIVTKISILLVAGVLSPILIKHVFTLQSRILIRVFEANFPFI